MMDNLNNETLISETGANNLISGMIALMFFYAAIYKLYHFKTSKKEMMNQLFPAFIARQLVWSIPLLELSITRLLLFKNTQLLGFKVSSVTMAAFSLYILISMSGVFGRIPCSCGGILKNMSYGAHLIFNIDFLVLAILAIAINQHWMGIYLVP